MKKTIRTHNAEETKTAAKEFVATLKSGDIVALYGDLGSGKTTFVQGVAHALGITDHIQSPTFLLIKPHTLPETKNGIAVLYHLDLYRLNGVQEISALGLADFLGSPQTVTFVEWAEKLGESLPGQIKRIAFTYVGGTTRELTLEYD